MNPIQAKGTNNRTVRLHVQSMRGAILTVTLETHRGGERRTTTVALTVSECLELATVFAEGAGRELTPLPASRCPHCGEVREDSRPTCGRQPCYDAALQEAWTHDPRPTAR